MAKQGGGKYALGPNIFNFGGGIGDGEHDGSLALSDIDFPSHVSELESFQSDYDNSVHSIESIASSSRLQDIRQEVEVSRTSGSGEESEVSSLPDLPEQAEENVNLFLAALKAATVQDKTNTGSEEERNRNDDQKSDVSKSSSNEDSYRFISKESFPESILTDSLQNWGRDLSLDPEELANLPSSTPFCGEAGRNGQNSGIDSRLSEKFLAPSKTPDNGSNVESEGNGTNPWSFSGASMLLQTPAPGTTSSHLVKTDKACTPETLKKPINMSSFSSPLQKRLWADSLSPSNKTFDVEKETGGLEKDVLTEGKLYPFDDSNAGARDLSISNEVKDAQNPFESNDGLSFTQDFQDEFSFESTDDAAKRLDKDEEAFVSIQVFDQEDAVGNGDNTMFSDYVLPGSSSKPARRSVIGINDPDDKGEVRISFGQFFATKTEELGTLNGRDRNHPRPQFECGPPCTEESPEAAPPRPLYRPSIHEGSEDEPSFLRDPNNSTTTQLKPGDTTQSIDTQNKLTEINFDCTTRSLPYGAEDETKKVDKTATKHEMSGETYTKNKGTMRDEEGYRKNTGSMKDNRYKEDRDQAERINNLGATKDNEGYQQSSGTVGDKEERTSKRGADMNTGQYKVMGPYKEWCQKNGGAGWDKEEHANNRGTAEDKKRGQRIEKKDPEGVSRFRRISSIDPNDSTLAALQFCQSSEGSKVLGMSTNELKLLSRTLAKVTHGESHEIYKVLVEFTNKRKNPPKTASNVDIDSLNFSDVFSEKSRPSTEPSIMKDQPGSPNDTDGLTFYHSDTSCDVSPTGSKFEPLPASVSSPPLNTSSPKSSGSSIAVQTESRDSGGHQELSVPVCSSVTTGTTTYSTRSLHVSPGATSSSDLRLPTNSAVQTSVTATGSQAGGIAGSASGTTDTGHRVIGGTSGIVGTLGNNANFPGSSGIGGGIAGGITGNAGISHGNIGGMTTQHTIPTCGITGRPGSASSAAYAPGTTYRVPSVQPAQPPPHAGYQGLQLRPVYEDVPKAAIYMTRSSVSEQLVRPQFQAPFSGVHTVYTSPPVWSTSMQPLARTAPHPHGFSRVGPPLGPRTGSVTDQVVESGTAIATWSADGSKPPGHRQDVCWNWRTERSSEIQMVIPPTLDFPGVLCVGLSADAVLPIHNPTTRWIRCSSVIIRCTLNGVEVDPQRDSPFLIRETTLIGPKLTENVKLEFTCVVAGIYVAEMKVISIPVGSVGSDNETSSAVVTIQGFSEHPYLEIVTEQGQDLDFGELHEGFNGLQPFKVVNKGRTAIPLKMLICSSSSPGIFIFSKKNSPDELMNLEINNTVLKCVLPTSSGLALDPQSSTIWVELVGKNYHCFEKFSQAQLFSAVINIQLDSGSVAKILGNISLQAVIGVTTIQVPKAFQMAMCLSSQVGQKVSRQLPLSNNGTISANVELSIPKYSEMFTVIPNKFSVKPGTTVTAEVGFCPRLKDSYETVIQISEVAYNKSYEVLLRGSSVDQESKKDAGVPALLSNKSWLSWTGVDIGKTVHKRLFLLNDSSEQSIQFQPSVLGEHSDFEIQRIKSSFTKGGKASEQITLRPKERVPIYVLFAPSSFGIFKSDLVLDQVGGSRFKVPLYAYAGTSNLSICETDNIKKTSDGYRSDLGQVFLGHRNIIKVTLKNTGSRAAFVKAVCFADHQIRLHYPKTHLSIVPSEFVLPERTSKELVVVFQPLQHDAKDCQSNVKRVATIVLHYGDEILRQWYRRNSSKQHNFDQRRTTGNIKFDDVGFNKSFQDENCVAEDFDFPDLDDYEEVFDSHVSQLLLHLLGGPEKETKGPDIAAGQHTGVMETPQTKHVTEQRATIRCETPAQKESAMEEKVSNEPASWSLIPEQLSLKVPVKGSVDSTKKVQLLNYTNRPLEFEFSWPAHCIAVTPHAGTIPPKNQASIHISVWSSISSAGIELPWRGTAYVNCDGTRKALAIQIHKSFVNDDSPVPTMINKQLAKIDASKDDSLLHKMSFKPPKQNSPLTVTPKVVSFAKTEVGKVSVSVVTIENSSSSSSVRWKISSVAPAYAKVSATSPELLRTSYAVFRFSSYTGLIRPGQTTKIEVEFRTRDVGVYCQIWDLQTNPESPLTSTKTQLELSGEAILPDIAKFVTVEKKRQVRLSEPLRKKESVITPSSSGQEKKKSTAAAKVDKTIYFESDNVQFPDTAVGKNSSVKIKLCNTSSIQHQFKVIPPSGPFTLKRAACIPVKAGHFLKMPVYFTPKEPSSVYSAVVSFENLDSGEIISVTVHGKSCKK